MKASGTKVNEYYKIGQRIKFYRNQADMSQANLSRKIGFKSPTAVFFIEQGKRRVKVFDLIAISQALGVTLDMLISGVEIMSKAQSKINFGKPDATSAVSFQSIECSAPSPIFLTTDVSSGK